MYRLYAVFFLCFATLVPVEATSLPDSVAQALKDASVSTSHVAAVVHEIGHPASILSHNASTPMNPASVMKLVTAYAALELLGPAYTWTTEIYRAGGLESGVLSGDLVFKGAGDPRLTIDQLWLLLKRLRARGITEIAGDVILDKTYYALVGENPGRFDNQPNRAYNVSPDALLVNFNAVNLGFVPEPEANAVRIVSEPTLKGIEIINRVKLDGEACGEWRSRLRREVEGTSEAPRLVVSGLYSAACGEKTFPLAFLSHSRYFNSVFRELWNEVGGRLRGSVREGELPADATLVLTHESAPVAEVMREINKWSNNVMARQLFLTIGAHRFGPPATLAKARAAIAELLQAQRLAMPELVLENGSGLSRIERINARSLTDLLVAAYRRPWMPEFIASLPITALDGTMKRRLGAHAIAGQAHVKTGSLDGVRSMAGYVLDSRGRTMAVVFLVNHPRADYVIPAEEALLRWVYERQ